MMLNLFGKKVSSIVRPIAWTVAFPVIGFLLCFLVELLFGIEIHKLTISIVNLVVVAFVAFFLFPQVFGVPFGKIKTRDFNKGIGFYLPDSAWKHVLLGVILALCTLSGMLIGIFTPKVAPVSTVEC